MEIAANRITGVAGFLAIYIAEPKPARLGGAKIRRRTITAAGKKDNHPFTDDHEYMKLATRIDRKVRAMVRRDRAFRFGPSPGSVPTVNVRCAEPDTKTKGTLAQRDLAQPRRDRFAPREHPCRLLSSYETIMSGPSLATRFRPPP